MNGAAPIAWDCEAHRLRKIEAMFGVIDVHKNGYLKSDDMLEFAHIHSDLRGLSQQLVESMVTCQDGRVTCDEKS